MYPRTVLLSFTAIMGTAVMQYLLFTPEAITTKDTADGFWHPHTGDFDWCEYNYAWTEYIAEPWNTFTSLIYIIVAFISIHNTSRYIPANIYVSDLTLLTVILIFIGIGSTLFHATLRYETQLLDELPMHWMVCFGAAMFYTRPSCVIHDSGTGGNKRVAEKSRNFNPYACTAIFCAAITVILWSTERQSTLHQLTRVIETISFGVGFIYTFYIAAICGNEVCEVEPKNAHYRKIDKYFDGAFFSFVIALLGWLCDNVYCQIFQNLRLFDTEIPYLHFHAILWHIGTCIGLHFILLVILAHRIVFRYRQKIKCITIAGILPYVTVDQKSC
mmetsp:Transcript_6564/g.10767  ORF Transcript_6564/g.10767 Transcript_6564/m.10767 type:complete len:330 (-) Transcript_6564:133-1122(-)|eukprot:CAMPEP_0197027616 /NCGR_PEP_ID=MMETSP1384-20130603/7492_1 /TAXON_ID=29189 /ORGANISM="Ammonia sp." /LENGTH=329 /DNA_ID=CAMNT_0042456483 /DNA_START=46 /DNA_END=1035 /DNA_ORIENTATION=-